MSANTDGEISFSLAFGSLSNDEGVYFLSAMHIKSRKIGANTLIHRHGKPEVRSRVGGSVALVTSADAEGFNPLDLLCASLASCLALSFRIAASEAKMMDKFRSAKVEVTATKSEGEFKRIDVMEVGLLIDGDFTQQEREALAHRAEAICTVSNTLKASADITLQIGVMASPIE